MSPGVHSIDMLTLMDVISGYAVNLRYVLCPRLNYGINQCLIDAVFGYNRSVMDVVVHEAIEV